jgi:Cu+-exporting ATPase
VQRLLARLKIFLRNALVIEHMAGVDTIVLDKTGTLTTADARGVHFQGAELSALEREWISSLARHSTHPNSVRIAKALGNASWPVANFKETPGCGVEGEVEGKRIVIGSRTWVGQASRLSQTSHSNNGDRRDACPTGSVCIAINGVIRGSFSLENSLRPEVESLINQLGGRYKLALLSGDNERDAARFLEIFGQNATLHFNQSPADKLGFIRDLQQRGRKVMMVGDGLNDAGALKQADVGVAVVEQIGAFSPASDVILDAAELPRLGAVLQFSRGAARVVRAGFVISALYNLLGVTIAAAGLLQPMVCAILMPISSASVVFFSCSATTWMARRFGLMAGQEVEIRNPNSRNPKEIRNSKSEEELARALTSERKREQNFAPSSFGLRISFGFRPSNFGFETKKP